MDAGLEALVRHFGSEERKRGFQEAGLSRFLAEYPRIAAEIEHHDSVETITHRRVKFVVLSGNPVLNASGDKEFVVQYRHRDRTRDYMLFPKVKREGATSASGSLPEAAE